MVVAELATVQKELSIKWKERAYSFQPAKEQSFNSSQAETREGKGSYTLRDPILLQGESVPFPLHPAYSKRAGYLCLCLLACHARSLFSSTHCHSLFLVSSRPNRCSLDQYKYLAGQQYIFVIVAVRCY